MNRSNEYPLSKNTLGRTPPPLCSSLRLGSHVGRVLTQLLFAANTHRAHRTPEESDLWGPAQGVPGLRLALPAGCVPTLPCPGRAFSVDGAAGFSRSSRQPTLWPLSTGTGHEAGVWGARSWALSLQPCCPLGPPWVDRQDSGPRWGSGVCWDRGQSGRPPCIHHRSGHRHQEREGSGEGKGGLPSGTACSLHLRRPAP